MPQHQHFKKDLKTSKKANLRNKMATSKLKTSIKLVRKATDRAAAEESLKKAIPVIDSTARKGIIHPNKAARTKSQLSKFVASLPEKKS